jgi:hypothetical protein
VAAWESLLLAVLRVLSLIKPSPRAGAEGAEEQDGCLQSALLCQQALASAAKCKAYPAHSSGPGASSLPTTAPAAAEKEKEKEKEASCGCVLCKEGKGLMAAAIRDQLGALSAKLARGRGIAALHTTRAATTAESAAAGCAAFGSAVGGVGGALPGEGADVEVVETTALAATAGAVLRALIFSKEQGASL